ncbi:MAG: hypothetical protein J6S23_04545 [Clostridia bacterium]|nr:hypothetical protein [Clostridia bacterium]
MKNTNLKLNKTKLVAKLMLIVILVVSVLNLSSCNINFPWTQRGWFSSGGHFDTFKDAEEYINNSPKDGNTFILFDLDNEESVEKISYDIDALGTVKNKKLVYSWGILYGNFEIRIEGQDNNIEVGYQVCPWRITVNDNAVLEMKLDEVIVNNDYRDPSKQIVSVGFVVCDGNQVIINIGFDNGPLLEDGNYEEYYSDVCDMLLENLVVIK